MSAFKTFLQSGHSPTLFAALLCFACSCAMRVLSGAMAPILAEAHGLTAAQQGVMLAAIPLPSLAGVKP